jgi:hypothetical protein
MSVTAQELAAAINSDMRRVQDTIGLTPSVANAARLSDAVDRLDAGIEAGTTAVQAEVDAGRRATAQYRLLDTAINSAIMLRDRAETVLSSMATAGVRTPGDDPEARTRQSVARRSSVGWVIGGGLAALGAGYLVLHFLGKKRPVPAGSGA